MKKVKQFLGGLLTFALIISCVQFFGMREVKAANIGNAISYTFGTEESGIITEDHEEEYYQFTLRTSGKVELSGSAYMAWIRLRLYDEEANELWSINPEWNSTSEVIPLSETVYLTAGVYYLQFARDGHDGKYQFRLKFTSSEESFSEEEGGSNNSLATANMISTDGTEYRAQMARNDDKDFFCFQLAKSGKVDLKATFYKMGWVYWMLYDEEGNELLKHNPEANGTTENITLNETIFLTSGTYYLAVERDGDRIDRYGTYKFSLSFSSSNETYPEENGGSNNSLGNASALALDTMYRGQIAINDDKDFYEFQIVSDKKVKFKFEAEDIAWIYVRLYDASGTELWSHNFNWNSVSQKISWTDERYLLPGKYFIVIERDGNHSDRWGNYGLQISQNVKEPQSVSDDEKLLPMKLKVTAKKGKKTITVSTEAFAKVKIKFLKPKSSTYTFYANAKGTCKIKWTKKLKKNNKIQVNVSKDGYISKKKTITVK